VWQPTVKGVQAIEEGWYTGEFLDPAAQKEAKEARPALRFALKEALRRLRACTNSPDDLAWTEKMEPLTQPRERAKFGKDETP
jgi:phosphopantetheinyl transferase (holo-ACP synthase)